jgi:hypothetical protein
LYSKSFAAETTSFSVNVIPKRSIIAGNELYCTRPDGSAFIKLSIDDENILIVIMNSKRNKPLS